MGLTLASPTSAFAEGCDSGEGYTISWYCPVGYGRWQSACVNTHTLQIEGSDTCVGTAPK